MPPRQSAPSAAPQSTPPPTPPSSLGSAFAEASKRQQEQASAQSDEAAVSPQSQLSRFEPCGKIDSKGKLQCPGAILGRACQLCGSTGWKKRCPDCLGSRTVYKAPRMAGGQIKGDPCARCLGRGFTPPTRPELDEAVLEAEELATRPEPVAV